MSTHDAYPPAIAALNADRRAASGAGEAAALRGAADGEDHGRAGRLEPRAVVGAAVQALLREQIDARFDQVEGARRPVQLRAVDDRGGPIGDGDEQRAARQIEHRARL